MFKLDDMWFHLLPSHQDTRITRKPSFFVMETSLINSIDPSAGLYCGSSLRYSVYFPFFTKQAALGRKCVECMQPKPQVFPCGNTTNSNFSRTGNTSPGL